jgi:hypothetical protein
MLRRSDAFLALFAPLLVAGSCGEKCPPVILPSPMTELRAKEIDPNIVEGIALSTTLVRGDCRAIADESEGGSTCAAAANPACSRARAPMRVLLVEIETSVPYGEDACPGRFRVEDLAPIAALDARASAEGELVAPVGAGRYTLYVSHDDRCATCGLEESEGACVIEVPRGGLAVRDLVLDQSTR